MRLTRVISLLTAPKARLLLGTGALLASLALIAGKGHPVLASSEASDTPAPYRPHEVIVQFEPASSLSNRLWSVQDGGGLVARGGRDGSRLLVTLGRDLTVTDAMRRYRQLPGVVDVEPNGLVHAQAAAVPTELTPNDPLFRFQWNMSMLDARRSWMIERGAPSVVVAVLDTGIAYEDYGRFRKAPDWGGTVFVPGFNVLTGDTHANDDGFHGTHVASTIAEATGNAIGATGLAFGCALMPVKVLDSQGEGSLFDVADGIYYAFRDAPQKAKVINLSLGSTVVSRTLGAAIDAAVAAGVVVVAASGNDRAAGGGPVNFPASHPSVIAVGAVDARKQRAAYSGYGPELDVVAPGGDLGRDDNDDGEPDGVLQQSFDLDTALRQGRYNDFGYFFMSGTSSAAAHATAMAALLVSRGITSPEAVRAAMTSTAEDLGPPGRDDEHGYGLIRPAVALAGLGLGR